MVKTDSIASTKHDLEQPNMDSASLLINNFSRVFSSNKPALAKSSNRAKSVMSRHEKDKKLQSFIAAKVEDITFRKYEQSADELNAVEN